MLLINYFLEDTGGQLFNRDSAPSPVNGGIEEKSNNVNKVSIPDSRLKPKMAARPKIKI